MRRLTYTILGSLPVLLGCGIVAMPCEPGCKDETTRIVCDAAGSARTEVCPPSTEECAAPACKAGACTFKPAIGARCGESGGALCNEGFACMGGQLWLSAMHRHTCLAAGDGKAWCWGDNSYGQLGDGTDKPGLHPVLVRGMPGHVEAAKPGYSHTCALLKSGEIYCWGNNRAGQCGVPASTPIISAPVRVDVRPAVQFTLVAPGEEHTCAITADKDVYCWGNTTHGQCGSDPAKTGEPIVGPTKVPELDSVTSIVTGKNHSCALRATPPILKCWGSNTYSEPPEGPYVRGKLGPNAGDIPYSADPIEVALDADVESVVIGSESTYARTKDTRVLAWGRNERLQLGTLSQDKIIPRPTEVLLQDGAKLVPLTGVLNIVRSGGSDQCVEMINRLDFGTFFLCWGTDDWGELGVGTKDGARATHQYPVAVRALPSHARRNLARGEDHACGAVYVNERTEIWCYGRPGALGNGTERADDTEPPTQWQGTPVVWDPANFAPALE